MPKRQRWTPIEGTQNRVYDPRERWLLRLADLPGRLAWGAARGIGLRRPPAMPDAKSIRDVLVFRLDRIGDVLMSLPALGQLRAALPHARIRLVVGRWSEPIAQSAPVNQVLVWNAPWVGRACEGSETFAQLARKARALRGRPPDVAIDLQGDLRAAALMWLTGARIRVGYANTGGAYLLTHVVPLDETVSWVQQTRRAVTTVIRNAPPVAFADPLTKFDREFASFVFDSMGLESRRPLVGIHPSGGRPVKQWGIDRWRAVAARLQEQFGATILVTGTEADRPLAAELTRDLPQEAYDFAGRYKVRETLALIARFDLFLSPDTGPMHMACATGTPSVSVFGPSDPARYFSGRDLTTGGRASSWHVVVRPELWCSPCNLIRRPPRECTGPAGPECLRSISVDRVAAEAARLLKEGGFAPVQ